jgi:pimeloyl-ACP methyl ester carboxylesterase
LNVVLIHGGAHGAWCWDRLVPHLLENPHVDEVVAVDLMDHGTRSDIKPLNEIRLATNVLLGRDKALPPAYQREQARNAGVDHVVPFDAGHSAFLSKPKQLAELLCHLANT